MLAFAIRQLVVYAIILVLSLFIGRVAGPGVYATFTLFNFFFGLTYIIADFGYGKAVIREKLVGNPPAPDLAGGVNLVFGLFFGVLACLTLAAQNYTVEAWLTLLFFVAASSAFRWFFASESKSDFAAIGKAEIMQVVVYATVFFAAYLLRGSAADSLFAAVMFRCLSIPLSYSIFSRNRPRIAGLSLGGLNRVLGLFYNGFFYQASLILFSIKDLILAYVIFWDKSGDLKGLGFMAQTYMMLPLMVVNPLSRFLLPRLSQGRGNLEDKGMKNLVLLMAAYALISTAMLVVLFPVFNTLVLNGNFDGSRQFLAYFACANLISIPSLGIASLLAVGYGYRVYLCYALLCTGLTWGVGFLKLRFPGDDYGYPSAVLAGHLVNLGLLAWFFVRGAEVGRSREKSL